MNGLITLTFSGFPNGYCYPGDPSEFASDLVAATVVSFNVTTGNVYYNFGPNVPSVDNRVYPWLRTGSDTLDGWHYWGTTTDGITGWLMRHRLNPGDMMFWPDAIADLNTFDGGSNAAVTDGSGPFWEVMTDLSGRFPLGAGTVGSSTIAVGDTGGAHEVSLTTTMLGHTHAFGNYSGGNDDARFLIGTSSTFTAQNSMEVHGDTGNPQEANITAGNLITGPAIADASLDPVPTMPPYYAGSWLRRTDRIYHVVV